MHNKLLYEHNVKLLATSSYDGAFSLVGLFDETQTPLASICCRFELAI